MAINLNSEEELSKKNYEFAVRHTSEELCGDLLAPCWEIKEGGECKPGVYSYIDPLTFCGLDRFLTTEIHGCLSGHDPNTPDCFIHKFAPAY